MVSGDEQTNNKSREGHDVRSKLLNLTGFFSSLGGSVAMVGTPVGGVELISGVVLYKVLAGPRQEGASPRKRMCRATEGKGETAA